MGTLAIATRRAVVKDAQALSRVHDAAWMQAYAGMIPSAALSRMVTRRGPRWWVEAIRRSTLVLALDVGGVTAGYATLGRNRVPAVAGEGEIYELYLLPEYQGIGLGTELFLAARAELRRRGLRGAAVWVLADNAAARRFYENAGGRATAEGYETFDGRKMLKVAYTFE